MGVGIAIIMYGLMSQYKTKSAWIVSVSGMRIVVKFCQVLLSIKRVLGFWSCLLRFTPPGFFDTCFTA